MRNVETSVLLEATDLPVWIFLVVHTLLVLSIVDGYSL